MLGTSRHGPARRAGPLRGSRCRSGGLARPLRNLALRGNTRAPGRGGSRPHALANGNAGYRTHRSLRRRRRSGGRSNRSRPLGSRSSRFRNGRRGAWRFCSRRWRHPGFCGRNGGASSGSSRLRGWYTRRSRLARRRSRSARLCRGGRCGCFHASSLHGSFPGSFFRGGSSLLGSFRSNLGRSELLKVFANLFRGFDVNRTGVRLLFGDAYLRQVIEDYPGLDLEFAGQFVNADLVRIRHCVAFYSCGFSSGAG